MDITFISQEPEICRIFMDRLSAEGHCCFLEDDWLDFYLKLKNYLILFQTSLKFDCRRF